MRIIRAVGAIFIFSVITGCGSSPPVHYYGLEPMNITYEPDDPGSPLLGLGPLRTPEYLSRSQIVMRNGAGNIIIDDYHRWVEPLDQSVHRIVAANVDALLSGVAVLAFPYNAAFDLDYQLIGRVEQFDADSSSHAILVVQWSVVGNTKNIIVAPRRDRYEAQGASSNDAASITQAMNDCMAQFSRDVAGVMERVMQETEQ